MVYFQEGLFTLRKDRLPLGRRVHLKPCWKIRQNSFRETLTFPWQNSLPQHRSGCYEVCWLHPLWVLDQKDNYSCSFSSAFLILQMLARTRPPFFYLKEAHPFLFFKTPTPHHLADLHASLGQVLRCAVFSTPPFSSVQLPVLFF